MKTVQNKSMGLVVNVEVPDSVEEYNQLAGRNDACLEDAIQYNLFHSFNSEFRNKFAEAVEKETGIARNLNEAAMAKSPERKDGKEKTKIYENPGSYIARVLAEKGVEASAFQDVGDRIARSIKFDPSEGTRSGSGKVGKEYLAAAETIINAGPDKLEGAIEKLESLNTGLTIERNSEGGVDVDTLARAIKINADRKQRETVNELIA